MGKNELVFSKDIIGRTITGCIDQPSGQILLLDDGRTIEILKDQQSTDEGYWIVMGVWKPAKEPIRDKIPA